MRATIFLLSISLLATTSSAQVIGGFGFGGPRTRVVVLNATDDDAPIWIQIGDKATKQPVMRDQQWGRSYDYGSMGSVAVNATVCPTHQTIKNAVVYPPGWTTDEKFGTNALTDGFLRGDPSEKEVRKHIEGIEKALAGQLGRREKIAELKAWFRTVQHSGVAPTVTSCEDSRILTAVQDVSQWGYERTISFVVRGNRSDGYRWYVRQ